MLKKLFKRIVSNRSSSVKTQLSNAVNRVCIVDVLEDRRLMASSLTLGMNVNNLGATTYPQVVNMLRDAGQKSVRIWAGFSSYDSRTLNGSLKYASRFKADGFDVMVSLVPSDGQKGTAAQVKGMMTWLMDTPGLKESVDRWQIGNEPDHAKYWQYGVGSYVTDFLKPAAEVLHAYGEKAVSAGPSWNPEDIKTMVKYGLLTYADFVGYHPYRSTLPDLKNMVAQVKAAVNGKPLVASEWNVRGHETDVDAKYWAADIQKFFPVIAENFYAAYYFAAFAGTTKAGRAGVLKSDGSQNNPFYSAVKSLSVGFNGTDPTPDPNPTPVLTASITGTSFDDNNSNGVYDSGDILAAGSVVFLDTNGNNTQESGEKSVVVDSAGKFSFTSLAAGSYSVRRVYVPGFVSSTAAINLTLTAGQAVTGLMMGAKASTTTPPPVLTASLAGTSFGDTNTNGVYDAGDVVAAGNVIFLDTNGNNTLDTGEKSVQTDSAGNFSFTGLAAGIYNVRRVFPSDYVSSTPAINTTLTTGQAVSGLLIGSKLSTPIPDPTPVLTGSLTGICFGDTNANGIYDAGDVLASARTVFLDANGDSKLDVGEISVQTDSAGKFVFSGLAAGTYQVRRVFPAGYISSTPLINLTLTAGQVVTGLLIGSKAATTPDPDPTPTLTSTLSGLCFGDKNANGIFDTGDSLGTAKSIFLDLNSNNQLDAGEKSVLTDSAGKFVFSGLAAGTYKVRREFPTGWLSSTPLIDVTVTAGQTVTGLVIGSKAESPLTPPPVDPTTPPPVIPGNDPSGTITAPKITGFTILDAATGKALTGYSNISVSKTITLSLLPTRNIQIIAIANAATGSVQVGFTGRTTHTENNASYELFVDSSGNAAAWTAKAGTYSASATAYAQDNLKGTKGNTLAITLKFV